MKYTAKLDLFPVLLLAYYGSPVEENNPRPETGKKVPGFTLQDASGNTHPYPIMRTHLWY